MSIRLVTLPPRWPLVVGVVATAVVACGGTVVIDGGQGGGPGSGQGSGDTSSSTSNGAGAGSGMSSGASTGNGTPSGSGSGASSGSGAPVICEGVTCKPGASCVGGECLCVGLVDCGDVCADLTSDYANCGTCGDSCDGTEYCEDSQCQGDN